MRTAAACGVAVVACLWLGGMPSALGQDVNVKFDVGPAKAPMEWRPLIVREGGKDVTYYRVPDALLRSLGLPTRDIPDDQNAALVYWQAFNMLRPEPAEAEEAFLAAQKAPWGPEDGPGFQALYDHIQGMSGAHALLRKAAAMPECRFPSLWREPVAEPLLIDICLPHLATMRQSARELAVEAHLLEKQGKLREALETYLTLYRLSRAAAADGMLIGGLVGIAVSRIGQNSMVACIENPALDADTLAWLAQRLDEAKPCLPDRAAWIPFERATALQAVRNWLAVMPLIAGVTMNPEDLPIQGRALRVLLPDRTVARDVSKYLDEYARLLAQPTWVAAKALANGAPLDEQAGCKDWDFFQRLLLSGLDRAGWEYGRLEAHYDGLRTDVALRRYRLAHGQWPETLDKLSPEFLKELPPDPFTGEPFHYRLDKGEWLLYSVGSNRVDDGGIQDPQDPTTGDIVFRSKNRAD